MLAYIDSSLILNDVLDDPPVLPDLLMHLDAATSQITSLEIARTLRRDLGGSDLATASSDLLSGIDILGISATILEMAAALPVRFLRALDAIHVASALQVQADVVLTRDRQMQRACEALGLATA